MSSPTGQFPPTRWTDVEIAAQPEYSGQARALEELLREYLPVLRRYLVRQFRLDPAQAQDLLQSFVLEKVLQRGLLAQADRKRGRFRTFLVQVLTNFVLSARRRDEAQKRTPAEGFLSLESLPELDQDIPDGSAVHMFDVAFARQVIEEALRRMKQECAQGQRPDIWGVFDERIAKPAFEGAEPLAYEDLVRRFGFQSPGHASNALITAKRMYARALRAVVAEYAPEPEAVEAELKELCAILSRG